MVEGLDHTSMEGRNILCSVDNACDPTAFCLCMGSPTFLCEKHISEHYTKSIAMTHFMYPIKVYSYHLDAPRYQRLLARFKLRNDVTAEVRKNILEIDSCIAAVRQATEEYIERVRIEAEATIERLNTEKTALTERVEAAINSYETALYEDEVQMTDRIAAAMRGYKGDSDTLKMFEYALVPNCLQPVPEMARWCTNELDATPVARPVQHRPMAVFDDKIAFYSLTPGQKTDIIEMNSSLGMWSRYSATFVRSEDEVFLCGGMTKERAVLRTGVFISGREARVIRMLTPRYCHGLFHDPDWPYVYIFGGERGSKDSTDRLKSCERVSLSTYESEAIPDMTYPRAAFNPCRYKQKIYLCGGYESENTIEAYSPCMNLFAVVFKSLPAGVSEAMGCTSVLDGDEIVIISSSTLTRWKPSTKLADSSRGKPASLVWSTCRPVVSDREALIVCSDCVLRRIRLDSGAVEEEKKPVKDCALF